MVSMSHLAMSTKLVASLFLSAVQGSGVSLKVEEYLKDHLPPLLLDQWKGLFLNVLPWSEVHFVVICKRGFSAGTPREWNGLSIVLILFSGAEYCLRQGFLRS